MLRKHNALPEQHYGIIMHIDQIPTKQTVNDAWMSKATAPKDRVLVVLIVSFKLVWHILIWTKLPIFCRRSFQTDVMAWCHTNGFVQDCSNSTANALELLPSCTKLSVYSKHVAHKICCVYINSYFGIMLGMHDDVIKWKHFPRYWPFVRGIHRSTVNSLTKASDAELWCFLICTWINGCVRNHEAGDLRCHRGYYDVTLMILIFFSWKLYRKWPDTREICNPGGYR